MTSGAAVGGHGGGDAPLRELARWVDAIPGDAEDRLAGWSPATWERFRRLVTMHGLGAILADRVRASGRPDVVPPGIGRWLDEQEGLIARRVMRMHDELATILERAARQGIEVLPLKGGQLAGIPAVDPLRRPMADLDLLVRPEQRAEMGGVLEALGYLREPPAGNRPAPDGFLDAGGGMVISYDGEHPDNPRRVEIHVEAQRHLWVWLDEDDLTAALWATAVPGRIVGQPALVARLDVVFQHVAVHATMNLLKGQGRLLQWLDLARLAAVGAVPRTWVTPQLAYPALALAARAVPSIERTADLAALARSDVVARWARSVPLDGRAGLEIGRPSQPPRSLAARWERWRPTRVRLALAYGDRPLAFALARHALRIGRLLSRLTPTED